MVFPLFFARIYHFGCGNSPRLRVTTSLLQPGGDLPGWPSAGGAAQLRCTSAAVPPPAGCNLCGAVPQLRGRPVGPVGLTLDLRRTSGCGSRFFFWDADVGFFPG